MTCLVCAKKNFQARTVPSSGPAITATKRRAAEEAVQRINTIYQLDNLKKEASAEERLNYRQTMVKAQVEINFAWVKETFEKPRLDQGSKLYHALNYFRNQEQFLKEFLSDAMIPLEDNRQRGASKSFV